MSSGTDTLSDGARLQALRERLDALREEAVANQRKMERLFERELALLSAATLPSLLGALFNESAPVFDVEHIGLALVDHGDAVPSLLALRGDDLDTWPTLLVTERLASLSDAYAGLDKPWLGRFHAARHAALFPGRSRALETGSVALVPIYARGERLGALNLGCADPGRYAPDLGTVFLERLADIIGVALTNVMERERLVLMGLMDALTGLPNRRYFMQRLEQEVARAARYGHSIACLFVDGDRFKAVNDTYGHRAGDAVLSTIASRLRAAVRTTDVPARLGGEEFVVMLPQTGEADAADLAERIRRVVADQPVTFGERVEPAGPEAIDVTVSIGVSAAVPNPEGGPLSGGPGAAMRIGEALLDRADRALYAAKQAGRNRVMRADDMA